MSACPSSCCPASRCGPGSRPLPFPRASQSPAMLGEVGAAPATLPGGARFPSRSTLQHPPAVVSSGLDLGLWEVGDRSRGRGAARRMLSTAGNVLAIGRCQPLAQCLWPRSPLEAAATPVHIAATEPPVCVLGGRLLPGSVVSCRTPGGDGWRGVCCSQAPAAPTPSTCWSPRALSSPPPSRRCLQKPRSHLA